MLKPWTRTLLGALCRDSYLESDLFSWYLSPSGLFSTGFIYRRMARGSESPQLAVFWKAKIPLKIKIFAWQLARNRQPSGTKVRKRNGPGDGMFPLCSVEEDNP